MPLPQESQRCFKRLVVVRDDIDEAVNCSLPVGVEQTVYDIANDAVDELLAGESCRVPRLAMDVGLLYETLIQPSHRVERKERRIAPQHAIDVDGDAQFARP